MQYRHTYEDNYTDKWRCNAGSEEGLVTLALTKDMPAMRVCHSHLVLLLLVGLQLAPAEIIKASVYGGNSSNLETLGVEGLPTKMVVDRKGYTYLLGEYSSYKPNMFFIGRPLESRIAVEPFIAKLSPEGEVLWVNDFLGRGSSEEDGTDYVASASGLALGPEGDCFVAGHFNSASLSFRTSYSTNVTLVNPGFASGNAAIFVTKLDVTVGMVEWATLVSSPAGTRLDPNERLMTALIVDNEGANLYLGGAYDPGEEALSYGRTYTINDLEVKSYGARDLLLAQLSPDTGKMNWVQTYGGKKDEAIASLAVNQKSTQVIFLANSASTKIDLGRRVSPLSGYAGKKAEANTVILGTVEAHGSRRLPGGSVLRASAFGGTDAFNGGKGMALKVDPSDAVYVLGNFHGKFQTGIDTKGGPVLLQSLQSDPSHPSPLADTDVFLAKYRVEGDPAFQLLWAQAFGGYGQDMAGGMDYGGEMIYLSVFSAGQNITMGLVNPRRGMSGVFLENTLTGDYATTNVATVDGNNGAIRTAVNTLAPACAAPPGSIIDGQSALALDQVGRLYMWGPRYQPDAGPDAVLARTVCSETLPLSIGGDLLYHATISTLSCEPATKCTRVTGCV